MLTSLKLSQSQLDQLYDWVDGLSLSKPKKNISRDFADGLLMAQVISHFYPKLVQLHNYPSGNSYKVKITNWNTLNNKVMCKLGLNLTEEDCSRLANAAPMAIEAVLYSIKRMIDDMILLNHQENTDSPRKGDGNSNQIITNKQRYMSSRVDELREILQLIKDKINMVEKSLERKDVQIKQIEEILRQAGP